jgi:hypothetical protein
MIDLAKLVVITTHPSPDLWALDAKTTPISEVAIFPLLREVHIKLDAAGVYGVVLEKEDYDSNLMSESNIRETLATKLKNRSLRLSQ